MTHVPGRLLPDDVLALLDRSTLWSKSRMRGTMQGRRKSKQQGASLEFADYRLYSPGDDIRRLDWNAYGRTGRPFIKLFLDEQELQVSVYVDGSASMQTQGDAGSDKFRYARQLAGCIGYAALSGYDRVSAQLFSDKVYASLPMLGGKASAGRLFRFLQEAEGGGRGDLNETLSHPASLPRRPGMSWIFSDFLYEGGVERALSALMAAKQEVAAVQVLSSEELNPSLAGDLKLIDSETGAYREVALSGRVLRDYREAVRQHTEELRSFCFARGIAFVQMRTDVPLAEAVTGLLRGTGLLQRG